MCVSRIGPMKQTIEQFVNYLRYERNVSPITIYNYRGDLELFRTFLTPPGEKTMDLGAVDARIVREFIGWLYERKLQKVSVARKLAALRTFFKFCVRERITKQNPARLVSTPKIPKRVPRVLTAEEMNGFLDTLAGGAAGKKQVPRRKNQSAQDPKLIPCRDRAILELLDAAGLRVSELVGLTLGNLDRPGQMVRVLGKGRKERVVPYGGKAQQALEAYLPLREKLLAHPRTKADPTAVFLNHRGGRL